MFQKFYSMKSISIYSILKIRTHSSKTNFIVNKNKIYINNNILSFLIHNGEYIILIKNNNVI